MTILKTLKSGLLWRGWVNLILPKSWEVEKT